MDRIVKLEELLAITPGDNFLQHALALEFIKTGNDEKARILFENILKNDPTYVGSYYHLAKLLERIELPDEAIKIYEKGMEECQKARDQHAYNELKAAYEDLVF